jgi:hypothetical protein
VGHKQSRVQALWKLFEIVSDKTYSFTVKILVEIVIDTSGFLYNAYKKYVKDPDCYDRRWEEEDQEWHEIETQTWVPGKYQYYYSSPNNNNNNNTLFYSSTPPTTTLLYSSHYY